jgi:UDPglucose 6-dehydrogenase
MKIGILGIGMIGSAIKKGFESEHDVSFFDPKFKDSKFEDVLNSEIIFICVPTDQSDDGSCDVSIVNLSLTNLSNQSYSGIVVIKSTVRPGFTSECQLIFKDLKICFVPEFLRERCAYEDFMNMEALIIGAESEEIFTEVIKVHSFLKPKKIIKLTSSEAETVKYMSNVYKAMKVVFSNIIYELSHKLEGNYDNVLDAFLSLSIKEKDYMSVNSDYRGYGGYCLPKDTTALDYTLKELGLYFNLIEAIDKDNKKFKITVPKGMRL